MLVSLISCSAVKTSESGAEETKKNEIDTEDEEGAETIEYSDIDEDTLYAMKDKMFEELYDFVENTVNECGLK